MEMMMTNCGWHYCCDRLFDKCECVVECDCVDIPTVEIGQGDDDDWKDEEREVRQRIAESIIAYSNKHHIKHNANMLCVRCDIAAAYSYAAKIALGKGEW